MSSIRNAHSLDRSSGSIRNYFSRGIAAIISLQDQILVWPTLEDRQEHSRLKEQVGFKGCVGFVDGTAVSFCQRPTHNGDHFFDRNKEYSLSVQVFLQCKKKDYFPVYRILILRYGKAMLDENRKSLNGS